MQKSSDGEGALRTSCGILRTQPGCLRNRVSTPEILVLTPENLSSSLSLSTLLTALNLCLWAPGRVYEGVWKPWGFLVYLAIGRSEKAFESFPTEVPFRSRPVCRAGVCAGATLIFGKTVLSSDSLKVPLATNREKHVYPKEKAEVCPEKTALWQTPAHWRGGSQRQSRGLP